MTTFVPPKINTEFIFYIGLPSASIVGIFQASPTLATGDAKLSKDGGALADLTTLPTVTPASGKMVKITLSATEMNADNITVVLSDVADEEWLDVIINIQTSVQQIDELSTQSSVDIIDTNVDAILVDTGTIIPAQISSLADFDPDVDIVEGSLTFTRSTRLLLSAMAGKVSGAATATNIFRDTGDTKDRITATVDVDGNRTAVTLDST